MVKVVTFFLIGILILAMFGKLRLPKLPNPLRKRGVETAVKCKKCGAYIVGKGPCACEKKKNKSR
jgi:hypothetical protein